MKVCYRDICNNNCKECPYPSMCLHGVDDDTFFEIFDEICTKPDCEGCINHVEEQRPESVTGWTSGMIRHYHNTTWFTNPLKFYLVLKYVNKDYHLPSEEWIEEVNKRQNCNYYEKVKRQSWCTDELYENFIYLLNKRRNEEGWYIIKYGDE